MNELYKKLLTKKEYQEILKQLPEDERKELLKSMEQLVDYFDKAILKPLEKLKAK